MRLTAGTYRGKRLQSPEGLSTRPTSDRARQAIFNILHHAKWRTRPLLDNPAIMDVFAGTGALGLEALSQGGGHCIFIENDRRALAALRENIAGIGAENHTQILTTDACTLGKRPPQTTPRNLVFLDPPYGKNLGVAALRALLAGEWLTEDAVAVMEMAKKEPEEIPAGFTLMDERAYGVALVRFLMRER